MSQSTSASLLDRACRPGDDDAWRRLVGVYVPLLGAWLARSGLQPSDRDDLTQDVLGVLVAKLPTFRHNGRPGAFRAWLRTITVNRLRRFHRDRRGRPAAAGEDAMEGVEDSADDLAARWDREHDDRLLGVLLRRVEASVQEVTWQAFALHVLEGRPVPQVASSLGLTVNAVLIAKSRVLRRLRDLAGQLLD
ncbi:MAG: sigma-70 family RNA polymerase sigma factor [Gemmataceae bacterium]